MPYTHPFEPIWTPQSKRLILGSFPSVTSRRQGFYYAHPRNRFWSVIATLFGEFVPESVEDKIALLLRHNLALWDVLSSCDISGSDDAKIRQPVANDIAPLLEHSAISIIYCNGKKAYSLYNKYCHTPIAAVCLPSTSPANAVWNIGRLLEAWEVIL